MSISHAPFTETIILIIQLTLAIYLLPSGMQKLTHLREFVEGVQNYDILPRRAAILVGYILPCLEMTLSMILLAGFSLHVVAWGVILLDVSFLTAILINIARGREIACGCYGIAGTKVIGWGAVVRNALFLALSVTLAASTTQSDYRAGEMFGRWSIISPLDVMVELALIAILVGFCLIFISLAEWTVHIALRWAQLQPDHLNAKSLLNPR